VGRVFDNEDDFKRMDFTMADLDSGATWVSEARQQAARKRDRGDAASQFLAQAQATRSAPSTRQAQGREESPAEAEKEAGNQAFKQGNWIEAVEKYTAALKLDSSMLAAVNNRAMAYLKLGRWEEAEGDCSRVLAAEGGNVKALLRRATARREQRRPAEAVSDLEALLGVQPNNKEAASMLAEMKSGGLEQ